MADELTPIRQQYLEIKKQYPDTILLFRLGDFYETFDEDAQKAAETLDIVLTSRPVAKGVRVPMAGIPFHAVDNYLGRLIDRGYRVAICEQIGDQPERGLFPREVVRVVTPGTVTEPNLLHASRNNYLACFSVENDRAGFAFVDISTGEFSATQFEQSPLWPMLSSELERLAPAEVLASESLALPGDFAHAVHPVPSWYFEKGRAADFILTRFKLSSLDGLGLRDKPLAVLAMGALLKYLEETQKDKAELSFSFSTYSLSDFMVLDAETRRNLELTETLRDAREEGSLLWVLDKTRTPMGKRLLRNWLQKPLLDEKAITARLDAVEYFYSRGVLRRELSEGLGQLHDLERLVNRIASGHARPPELVALREDLQLLPTLRQALPSGLPALAPVTEHWPDFSVLCELLELAITAYPPATLANTGIICPGYSAELDQINESSRHAREWINNLEGVERARTGIKTLKVGFNKVFGYYIEVSRGQAENAPADYIRKQTLVNNERFITPELKEYETLVLNAETQIREAELRAFRGVCARVSEQSGALLELARSLAWLDCILSLAEVAALNRYTRPVLCSEKALSIRGGRHPVVERMSSAPNYIANDCVFEEGEIIRLITGPNMSGKSTFLRQVVLIVLLAQIGSFVPANEARLSLVDRIFTRIGAQDAIHQGQSTFMVEMIETANILNNATPRSLLILDEIGRGTSTYDGMSIAWAIVEYLHSHPRLKPFTLFATHYHELTELSELFPGVRNYNVAVTESDGRVIFLHKIVPGSADRSYGIHVAQMAGMPATVISRANEILKQLEESSGRTRAQSEVPVEQLRLFPENNPLIEAFRKVDVETLSPIQALNLLYEWKKSFFS